MPPEHSRLGVDARCWVIIERVRPSPKASGRRRWSINRCPALGR